MKEVSVKELKQMIDNKEDIQIIDVREPNEFNQANIEGELIPLGTIPQNADKISKTKKVIVHCRSGKRSENAIKYLEANHGLDNLYNLKGGILAWKAEIDNSLNAS
jgi:rhodanese-related sulfurtransferase